jgi:hypothetical protein
MSEQTLENFDEVNETNAEMDEQISEEPHKDRLIAAYPTVQPLFV